MKLTELRLRQIITEELQYVLQEGVGGVVWSNRNAWRKAGEPRDDVYNAEDTPTLQSALGPDYHVVAPPNQGGSEEEWINYVGDGRAKPMPHPTGATIVVPLNTFNTREGRMIWFKEATLTNPKYGSVMVDSGPMPEEGVGQEQFGQERKPWEHN
jgi:hypothetical protein